MYCGCNYRAVLYCENVMMKMYKILLFLFIFGIKYGDCMTTSDLSLLKVRSYEHDLNRSLHQNKDDKHLLISWSEEFQLKQVNLIAEYRIQMMKHRDHNFWSNVSEKWEDCMHIYQRTIKKMESDYNEEESICTKTALTAIEGKKKAVNQIEKEKRKWRKGYKYLENICRANYNSGLERASCITKYVESDGYNLTLQRLVLLKQKLMRELFVQFTTIIFDFGECLRINLYKYLYNVRSIVKVMHRCYHGRRN